MLPHRCILSNCAGAFELVRPLKLKDETYLSYLPLSHSYEHTVGQFFLLSTGTRIVYCRGVEHLAADMLTIRPTLLTAVPRVLEVIRGRILAQVARETPFRQRLFNLALSIGLKRIDRTPLTLLEHLLDPILERLVRAKVRARFGGRLKAAMSGGARLEPEVGRFFQSLGLKIMQGYGQTEAGPVITVNAPGATRIETVGRPLSGLQVRIAEDGEILVRGEAVMAGYWRDAEATAKTIQDGWLHTGDIGEFDADGNLRITDRKKDIIVRGGVNVSAKEVEEALIRHPAILQAAVVGMPDERLGQRICAFLVTRGDDVGLADLSAHIQSLGLARQKTPEFVEVVEELPLNASGKVQKQILRTRAAEIAAERS
jgi:long-chain acyl-CoA synthetase